jgi:hypothetical protein
MTDDQKCSMEHFNQMLQKFQPHLEKVALNAKNRLGSKLIKADKTKFINLSGKYGILGEKDASARETCKSPAVMAAATVLMGALDADGKTITNKDLKEPLMKVLAKTIQSTPTVVDDCLRKVSQIKINAAAAPAVGDLIDLTS